MSRLKLLGIGFKEHILAKGGQNALEDVNASKLHVRTRVADNIGFRLIYPVTAFFKPLEFEGFVMPDLGYSDPHTSFGLIKRVDGLEHLPGEPVGGEIASGGRIITDLRRGSREIKITAKINGEFDHFRKYLSLNNRSIYVIFSDTYHPKAPTVVAQAPGVVSGVEFDKFSKDKTAIISFVCNTDEFYLDAVNPYPTDPDYYSFSTHTLSGFSNLSNFDNPVRIPYKTTNNLRIAVNNVGKYNLFTLSDEIDFKMEYKKASKGTLTARYRYSQSSTSGSLTLDDYTGSVALPHTVQMSNADASVSFFYDSTTRTTSVPIVSSGGVYSRSMSRILTPSIGFEFEIHTADTTLDVNAFDISVTRFIAKGF